MWPMWPMSALCPTPRTISCGWSARADDGAITDSPAVTLAVAKRAGANAVVVAEEMLHRVHALEGSLIPDTVQVDRHPRLWRDGE